MLSESSKLAADSYSFTEAKDLCIGEEEQARPFTVVFAVIVFVPQALITNAIQ